MLALLGAVVLTLPGSVTQASWVDATTANSDPIASLALETPTVTCTTVTVLEVLGVPVLTKAVLTWSAFVTPETNVTLSYDAEVLGSGLGFVNATVNGLLRSVEITSDLLSGLLGGQKTVRVTGRLPLTSWTASSDVAINYAPAGLGVSCA